MTLHSSPAATRHLPVQTRWMIRRDMPSVLKIENSAFEFPWAPTDFEHVLKQRPCIGMVAENHGLIAGFVVYELFPSRIEILNFAVNPAAHRLGVGRQIVEALKVKLSNQRRSSISLNLRDSNLPAQLFFRAQGFRAERIIRGHYEINGEDAIRMVFTPDEMGVAK